MVALIIAAGALALLYFWLIIGHWFARVVMFLVLWPILTTVWWLILAAFMDGASKDFAPAAAFAMILGISVTGFCAWGVSGFPIRHRAMATKADCYQSKAIVLSGGQVPRPPLLLSAPEVPAPRYFDARRKGRW